MAVIRELRISRNNLVLTQVVEKFSSIGATLLAARGAPRLHLWTIVDIEAPKPLAQKELRTLSKMRLDQLQNSITTAVEHFQAGLLSQEQMEKFQDLVFAELNHRMQRAK